MTWTAFAGAVLCGYCGQSIAAREPVATLLNGKLFRCTTCAQEPVNDAEVDAARHALDVREATARTLAPAAIPASIGFAPVSAIASSRVLPFSELSEDIRQQQARAAGHHNN